MTRYAVGLGSNVGDRLQHLAASADELRRHFGEVTLAALYETEPVGGPEQDPFLNSVAVFVSEMSPHRVLDTLHEIEQAHDRERTVRWGPRTLDLDLVSADVPPIRDQRLTLPHPRAAEREFVLRPLADVWPEADVGGVTAEQALARVEPADVDFLSDDWLPPVSRWKPRVLLITQFALFLVVAVALAYDGTLPDGGRAVTRAVGAGVAFVGAGLAFVASRRLGGAMTASPVPKEGADLVMTGPYRFARHPIYGGLSLILMGTALVLDSIVGFSVAALLIPFFLVKARFEERQLRMRFAEYRAYRQTVHRRLIPFLI